MSSEGPTKYGLPEIMCGEPPGSLSGDSTSTASGGSTSTVSGGSPRVLSGDSPKVLSGDFPGLSGDSTTTLSDDSPITLSGDSFRALSGDAPASSFPWYHPVTGIEPFGRYGAGGYYPVRIGDQLCSSRYRVVHKLGYGGYSTIWLARDERSAKFVAIKIAVSELDRPIESAILRTLWDEEGCTIRSHVGVALVPDILDEFEVEGPEIKGVRAARGASYNNPFQTMVARAIAAQLVEAVASLHSRGIVHADLHEGNILFRLPNAIDDLNTHELYEKYKKPITEEMERLDGLSPDPWVPTRGIFPIWFGTRSDRLPLSEARIFLNDFGESFQPSVSPRASSRTPPHLRSPELFLDPEALVSFPAEIWSLACVIFHIMGAGPMFNAWFHSKDAILKDHVDALGRLPDEWWASWENRAKFFDDHAQSLGDDPPQSLEERFEYLIQDSRRECGMVEMDEEEKQAFLELMRSIVKFRPEDRVSAQQVLESRWMQNWAMPAFESMEDMVKTSGSSALPTPPTTPTTPKSGMPSESYPTV